MKVLQVGRAGSLKGGVETYVAAVCHGLRAAGHSAALVYGDQPDEALPEVRRGAMVPGLVRPGEHARAQDEAALLDAIASFAPDVIHVHVPEVAWVAPLCASRAPTLLAVHDHRLDCPVGTRYWAGWRRACTVRPGPWCLAYNVAAHCGSLRANVTLRPYRSWRAARASARGLHLQAFSGAMRDILARAGLEHVDVTPYPVPPAVDPIAPDEPDRRPVVLAGGRLNKEKGFHQLIEAFEHVREPAHLLIAGSGHARAALERRARSVGRRHRITFTGWLDPARLAGWRERAALIAVPSMWPEPFGIVGLEAMAAGKPVVAFDAGGIAEWLLDGRTGRLLAPGDVAGLGAAISALLADPQARDAMGAAARARAADFSLERHLDALLGLYREAGA